MENIMTIGRFSAKAAVSAAAVVTLLSVAQSIQAAALTISQEPLFLTEGVAPNLIVTLDDSGSMAWGYAPDGISGDHATRRFKSNYYNPMYYNPLVTYAAPKKVTYNSGTGQTTITEYSTSFTAAYINGYNTSKGSVNLSNNFRPTREYNPTSSSQTLANNPSLDFSASNRSNGVAAYYYLRDNSLSGCSANSLTDEDCYKYVAVGAAERQNFANWYSFYRTRALATQSAANLAFYTLPENVRVTWQMLNSCTAMSGSGNCTGATGATYNNRLKNFSGNHRQEFFKWLGDTPANGGTPLRTAMDRAGKFLSTTGISGAYAHTPGSVTNPQYACRPSYQILMTDGIWNGGGPTVNNYDNTNQSLPDGVAYTAQAPFKDGSSNTVADLAFKYWAEDASPIANNVKPFTPYKNNNAVTQYWDARNNPATWQHLVTYTLGLGLTRSLTDPAWNGSTFTGGYTALANGTKAWPTVGADNANNPYDLWHAAINSRGEFFSVDSPDGMVDAFKAILSRIADRETSAAAISVESAVASLNNEAYYAKFSSDTWSGELIKYDINSSGALSMAWNARSTLNSVQNNIKINNGAGTLVPFTWANLSPAQKTAMNRTAAGVPDALGSARVDFIRGSRDGEGTTFRERAYLLGDIVHSSPVVVGTPDRMPGLMNPLGSSTDATSYTKFKQDKAGRTKQIYVGANDGMLHAFNDSGNQTFAYIPTAVIEKLNRLTDRGYNASHEYFVDGTPVVGDVFFGGAWHTILVGTLRGGGRSMFALDITDPGNISLLWEFSSTDDADLGFTFTEPVITRLHNGKWGVVMSNGYNSTNDRAALFILDAENGNVLRKLVVDGGAGLVNGLSSPKTVDINGDLITDYVYAGDLLGNVWRFDLFSTSVTPAFRKTDSVANSTFRVAFGGKPLFTASNSSGRQPITVAPTLIRHPSGIGYMVTAGTGKYIESSDAQADTSQAMTLYGIWDRQTAGETASTTPSINRSMLVQQTMGTPANVTFTDEDASGTVTSSQNRDLRLISRNPVEWYNDAVPPATRTVKSYGWYLDLKEGSTMKGELVATPMTSRADVLLVATTTPNDDPCESGIDRWFIAIDGITGGATTFDVLDMSGNNTVDVNDSYNGQVVSSVRYPGFGSPAVVGSTALFNPENGDIKPLELSFGPYARGRQNWRSLGE